LFIVSLASGINQRRTSEAKQEDCKGNERRRKGPERERRMGDEAADM
jgi:hypothetical protein